ncbi:MAG: DoxX family protein [bacterium]|nr:DoxX family protein [bacterium]
MHKIPLVVLRLALGELFFYAGITKVLDPSWSAAGYLMSAKTFPGLYEWFASPDMLPFINFVNEWGLTLIGLFLVLGIFVRVSSFAGVALMILYYLPILDGWYPNTHSFLVDEHIVYVGALLTLATFRAGRVFGLEKWCSSLPICSRFPKFRALLG